MGNKKKIGKASGTQVYKTLALYASKKSYGLVAGFDKMCGCFYFKKVYREVTFPPDDSSTLMVFGVL